MRAYLVMLFASLAIPLAFISPLLGLVAYCTLAYMRPQDLAWGIGHVNFGLYTALALFGGLFVRLRFDLFRLNKTSMLIVALWGWWGLSSYNALDTKIAWEGFEHISRIFLICVVTVGLCVDKRSLRWVVLAIAGGLAFHGVKQGLFGLANPGVQIRNGIGGMISGNNENAIALGVALPFCVYWALDEERKWRRIGWWVATGLTTIAIVFSYSRGGFLGMVAAGLMIVWRTRYRWVSLLVLAPLAVGVFFAFAPDSYVERVSSIQTARKQDLSAIRRIQAWGVAAEITSRHPLTGIGPRNFPDQFERYPHPWDMPRMHIHNTYLEFTATNGIPALLIYAALVLLAFRNTGQVIRQTRDSKDPRLRWFLGTGRAMQAGMTCFLVSSTFGSLMHFDLMYHVCVLAACMPKAFEAELKRIAGLDEQADEGHRALAEARTVDVEIRRLDDDAVPVVATARTLGETTPSVTAGSVPALETVDRHAGQLRTGHPVRARRQADTPEGVEARWTDEEPGDWPDGAAAPEDSPRPQRPRLRPWDTPAVSAVETAVRPLVEASPVPAQSISQSARPPLDDVESLFYDEDEPRESRRATQDDDGYLSVLDAELGDDGESDEDDDPDYVGLADFTSAPGPID